MGPGKVDALLIPRHLAAIRVACTNNAGAVRVVAATIIDITGKEAVAKATCAWPTTESGRNLRASFVPVQLAFLEVDQHGVDAALYVGIEGRISAIRRIDLTKQRSEPRLFTGECWKGVGDGAEQAVSGEGSNLEPRLVDDDLCGHEDATGIPCSSFAAVCECVISAHQILEDDIRTGLGAVLAGCRNTILIPCNGAAGWVACADEIVAILVAAARQERAGQFDAVSLRKVVVVFAKTIPRIRSRDRSVWITDVQCGIDTQFVPEHFATQRPFDTNGVAACRVVATSSVRIARLGSHKTVPRGCAAFGAARAIGFIDDAIQDLAVKCIDDWKAQDIAIPVEIGARILRILFLVDLKDKEVQVIKQAVGIEIASAVAAFNPASRRVWWRRTLAHSNRGQSQNNQHPKQGRSKMETGVHGS